jgi:AcrR family transcriptional regulator
MNTVSTQKRKYELRARAEAQRATRARIAKAAAELHEQQGVASTTVADIARRAGVQRLTVYNHFADLSELLPACSAHYLELHPQPDLSVALSLEDPSKRVRAVLSALYSWYRDNEQMQERVQGERSTVPELEAWMSGTADVALAQLSDGLAAGFGLRGEHRERVHALIRLALDFWTWRRLNREGVDDEAAAELMASSVAAVRGPQGVGRTLATP